MPALFAISHAFYLDGPFHSPSTPTPIASSAIAAIVGDATSIPSLHYIVGHSVLNHADYADALTIPPYDYAVLAVLPPTHDYASLTFIGTDLAVTL